MRPNPFIRGSNKYTHNNKRIPIGFNTISFVCAVKWTNKKSKIDFITTLPKVCCKKISPSTLTLAAFANIAEIANGIERDGFEQIESIGIQELLESQDEDLTETDLEEMLNSQPIEEEASISTGNVTFNLKSQCEGLRRVNELCDFFMNMDPSMEQSLIFKRQFARATAAYQSEWKELLKTAKQEKIAKFFKPLPKS